MHLHFIKIHTNVSSTRHQIFHHQFLIIITAVSLIFRVSFYIPKTSCVYFIYHWDEVLLLLLMMMMTRTTTTTVVVSNRNISCMYGYNVHTDTEYIHVCFNLLLSCKWSFGYLNSCVKIFLIGRQTQNLRKKA